MIQKQDLRYFQEKQILVASIDIGTNSTHLLAEGYIKIIGKAKKARKLERILPGWGSDKVKKKLHKIKKKRIE